MTVPAYIRDVLTFPVRKDALPMLVIGTVISFLLNFAGFAGIIGTLASILWFGFLSATFFALILSSTNDHAGGPEFADASNVVEDILVPLVRILGVGLLSLLPLIIYWVKADRAAANFEVFPIGLTVIPIIYFPMAILAVAVLNNITAANPWLVIVSIFRTLPYYALCVALISAVYFLGIWLDGTMSDHNSLFDKYWVAAWGVFAFTGMFTMMATARALGLLYREKEEELNWI